MKKAVLFVLLALLMPMVSDAKIQPVDAPKIDFIFLTPKIQVKHTCITPTSVSYIMSDHNPHWADIQF